MPRPKGDFAASNRTAGRGACRAPANHRGSPELTPDSFPYRVAIRVPCQLPRREGLNFEGGTRNQGPPFEPKPSLRTKTLPSKDSSRYA